MNEFTGTYHKCMECGHIYDFDDLCPECGSSKIEEISADNIRRHIKRLDSKSIMLKSMLKSHGDLSRILSALNKQPDQRQRFFILLDNDRKVLCEAVREYSVGDHRQLRVAVDEILNNYDQLVKLIKENWE